MLCQVGTLAEGLAAHVARVGPLTCVHPLVLGELGAASEGFATVPAPVGLLPRVDALVLCQVGDPAEGLATLLTLMGLCPCVHNQVLGQVGALAEGFPTLIAGVGRLTGMALLVCLQGPGAPEHFPTFSALGRRPPRVHAWRLCPRTIQWTTFLFRRSLLFLPSDIWPHIGTVPESTRFTAGLVHGGIVVMPWSVPEICFLGGRLCPDVPQESHWFL